VIGDQVTLVARLDGVNFGILQESRLSTTDIADLVAGINESLAEPTYVHDVGVATTACFGVVQCPPHRRDAGALLHAADLTLRAARRAGPGQWALHESGVDDAERRLLRLAVGVPGAWETGQLEIGYESRVSLADGRPVGVHAFPRWREPGLGDPWHPSLDLAEQTGLTAQFAGWVLREAGTRQHADLVLTVSLSASQSAAPDLVDTVLSVLADAGLCPELLQITMPVAAVCRGAAENLRLVAAAGVRTAAHDFDGAAVALIQLADLPVTEVWLSKPLVRQAKRADKASLVAGLVALVHRTGAAVGVGDIQDPTEADWWRWAGADVASGRLYGPA
jgi:predicted signal transduction protein with EAL and GGDEF domain